MKRFFIHGWSFSSQIWKRFYKKEDTLLDLPFHGENKEYSLENTLDRFSKEIFSLIEKQNSDVCLIGWSLGASVSVLVTLRKPKNLKKIVLVGFSPKFKDKKLGHNPVAVKAFMMALKVDFKDTIYTFRKTAAGDTFKNIPLPEKEGSIRLLNEFINLDLTKEIENIDIETILIHGKQDKIISPFGSIYANQHIKGSKLLLVDSHHAPFLTHADIFSKEISL
ncbi:MAG: carboxylesterase [Aquificae bacterium]|nr:carboxylesterase [Aquificota bacterium]